MESAVNNK